MSPLLPHAATDPSLRLATAGLADDAGSSAGASPSTLGPDDLLTCRWSGCSAGFSTPETLYDHLCERHVGRKSSHNLCLICRWFGCQITTVKRDHITSHLRIHVPLKPHKCAHCPKSFKRPQDLKKHAKTHESNSSPVRELEPHNQISMTTPLRGQLPTANRPELPSQSFFDQTGQMPAFVSSTTGFYGPGAGPGFPLYFSPGATTQSSLNSDQAGQSGFAGFHQQNQAHQQPPPLPQLSQLSQLPRIPSHPHHPHLQPQVQQPQSQRHQQSQQYPQQQQQQQQQHHATVLAAAAAAAVAAASHERRRTLDILEEFLGALKRKQVDPSSYSDISRLLLPFQNCATSSSESTLGQPTLHSNYLSDPILHTSAATTMVNQLAQIFSVPSVVQPSPPSLRLRIKDDLMSVDQLLAQMQTTVYENPATVPGHGSRIATGGDHSTDSPQSSRPNSLASAIAIADPYATEISPHSSPAAPARQSSASSSDKQSPVSAPSTTNLHCSSQLPQAESSVDRGSGVGPRAVAPTYPQLSTAHFYPQYNHHNTPLPSLEGDYGTEHRQRFSNSMLQCGRTAEIVSVSALMSASPVILLESTGEDDDTGESRNERKSESESESESDGANESESESAEEKGDVEEDAYNQWLGIMQLLEVLRTYVKGRLERGDYLHPTVCGFGGFRDSCNPHPQIFYPRIVLPQS